MKLLNPPPPPLWIRHWNYAVFHLGLYSLPKKLFAGIHHEKGQTGMHGYPSGLQVSVVFGTGGMSQPKCSSLLRVIFSSEVFVGIYLSKMAQPLVHVGQDDLVCANREGSGKTAPKKLLVAHVMSIFVGSSSPFTHSLFLIASPFLLLLSFFVIFFCHFCHFLTYLQKHILQQ